MITMTKHLCINFGSVKYTFNALLPPPEVSLGEH